MNTTIGTLIGAAVWVVCQGVGLVVLISAVEVGGRLMRWTVQKLSWHR